MSDIIPFTDHMRAQPSGQPDEPDAHGQAALFLTESLLHTLIEAKVLTRSEAIAAVVTASEVNAEVSEGRESPERMKKSLELLAAIRSSLQADNYG